MFLHTDIPTRDQLDRLLINRDPASVSIYLPTDPASANVGERIELGNLASAALRQLRGAIIAAVESLDRQPLSKLLSLLSRVTPRAVFPATGHGIQ